MSSVWPAVRRAGEPEGRIADEPVTIQALLDRLLDLGGQPDLVIGAPNIGRTLRDVLDDDMSAQRDASPPPNGAAEEAGAAHDATTRVLLEGILADEERHLWWLQAELDLLDRLGDALSTAPRLTPTPTGAPTA